ncbi:MAG: 1,4-alpha-glucan branching protein GlgB [Clostridiales bacterium]|jgi:1,4-alpha-glucan branching enzyme|nr:1,4-alpha-glucan branching protein GlgB [Clostridiales bacterium]
MNFTAGLTEILQIVGAEYADPHRVLGMHETHGRLFVRAFVPDAAAVCVICPNSAERWPLERVHVDGFFEGEIVGRDAWFLYELELDFGGENVQILHDPYAFPPVLTEYDMHLFASGTHYKIADKLGANPMILEGVEGVNFAVWAPNADRVSVIGDFNSYDGRRHAMRLRPESGIWELFIPAIKQYDAYKFEIKTRAGELLQKSDPFEKYHQLRPSTNSLVYNLRGFEWEDGDWLKLRAENPPIGGPINIYEVNLASWVKGRNSEFSTYVELAHELVNYMLEMGYTHIELMPITEHPYDPSWGYQVTGYYAATSRFGTPHEFKYFVNHCHKNNIGVILDWVPAHFPKDSHGLAKFDGTALFEHEDPRQAEHPDWGTLMFNYGRKEVANFLIANALFWVEEYHIDGLRVDAVASMLHLNYSKYGDGLWVPNEHGGNINLEAREFLKHLNSIMREKHPHVLMIAEESTAYPGVTAPVGDDGLGFSLKWNMGWMNDFLKYVEMDPIYRSNHHNLINFAMMYHYNENFVLPLSHDEVVHGKKSLLNKMPGDLWQKFANLRVSLGFMYAHPGKKLLFMGGEFGQFIEWDEKRPLDWFLLEFPHHKNMQNFSKDLNHLYRREIALWGADFDPAGFAWIDADDAARSIASFARFAGGETLIIACNFTPVPYENHRLGLHNPAIYQEILNSDNERYGGSGITNPSPLAPEKALSNGLEYSIELRLPPLGIVILKAAEGDYAQ